MTTDYKVTELFCIIACIIHRGNFNGYTFLNMLLHMKTNQHSDVSRGLSKKILP